MATLAVAALTALGTSAATAATIGTALSYAGTALAVGSAVAGVSSSRSQAKAIKGTAAYNAEVANQEATQERASSLREASEERRKGRITASSLIAQAAKGGGGIDPTAMKVLGEIAGESEFRAGIKTATGEERARGLERGADLGMVEATQKARTTRRKGITTALGTVGATLF